MDQFLRQFAIVPSHRTAVGVEMEFFLADQKGRIVPKAKKFLKKADDNWTYELSACQVEFRTKPCFTEADLRQQLLSGVNQGKVIAEQIGCQLLMQEVAPFDMPLDIYPDQRYKKISRQLQEPIIRAACRVAGIHIHLGIGSFDEAIDVYNRLIKHTDELLQLGDHSNGERNRLYQIVAPRWEPVRYNNLVHFYHQAKDKGFAENPRNCWQVIRISWHGTVEVRTFGMTQNIDEILSWVKLLKKIAFQSN